MTKPPIADTNRDFSLVLGGPLFQLFRRARLSGDVLERVWRRVLVIAAASWVPLLILSLISGHALGGARVPFLYDIEAHIRFLIALPILIGAELIVHARIRPAVKSFAERRIIVPADMPKFHAAIDWGMRVRNSMTGELTLLVLVYTLGLWLWRSQIAMGAGSWYAMSDGARLHFTLAGYWYEFVSIPIFQFILLRWYFRFFLWFQLLWRLSRLNLRLFATHPDRTAGLGFLGLSTYAFGPILFAQGALLAGLIANRVLYEGQSVLAFKMEAAGLVIFFVGVVLSPLLVFVPHLSRAKRNGLRAYGLLGNRYVQGFEGKWMGADLPQDEELLGTGDIQSLADLGNSFAVVSEMRVVPFGLKDAGRLAAATAAPLLPLALTIFSLEELVKRLIKIIF